MASQDERIRQIFHEIGQALARSLTESREVGGAVRRIRDEGYDLYLLLDGRRDGDRSARIPIADDGEAPPRDDRPPEFRLDGDDVALLKSLGIDPTRTVRRRRRASGTCPSV